MPPDSSTLIVSLVSGYRRALQSAVVSAAPSAPKCSRRRAPPEVSSHQHPPSGNISIRQRRWAACMQAPGGRHTRPPPRARRPSQASSFPLHRKLSRLVRRAWAEAGRLGGSLVRARRVGLAGDAHLLRPALFGRLRRRAVRLIRARCRWRVAAPFFDGR